MMSAATPVLKGSKYDVVFKSQKGSNNSDILELEYHKKDKLVSQVVNDGPKWGYIDTQSSKDSPTWTIKTKFSALAKGQWELITSKGEAIGKMKIKAFVRNYVLQMDKTNEKYGNGDVQVQFNDPQTEFVVKRQDRFPRTIAMFTTEDGKKVGETTSGTVRVAKGELLHFNLAICSLFVLLMREFNDKPTRYKKQWLSSEETTDKPQELESTISDNVATPRGKSTTSPVKSDADSGSLSPAKKPTKETKEKKETKEAKNTTKEAKDTKKAKKAKASRDHSEDDTDDTDDTEDTDDTDDTEDTHSKGKKSPRGKGQSKSSKSKKKMTTIKVTISHTKNQHLVHVKTKMTLLQTMK